MAAALLLTACQTAEQPVSPAVAGTDIEWRQILEEKSRIVFRVRALEGGVKRFYVGVEKCGARYLGRWVGPSGRLPRATIVVSQVAHNCVFTLQAMRPSLKDFIKSAERPEGKRVSFGKEEISSNSLGRITYLRYSVNSTECVSFRQFWRTPFRGLLQGVYCADATGLSRDAILTVLKAIAIR